MSLPHLDSAAREVGLAVRGAFHPVDADGLDKDVGTLVLLGPDEPAFWQAFQRSPEYTDGGTDPMNRWSERVIGVLAQDWDARALFPFGGPPWHPFIRWAERSGQAWISPVGLMVHATAGLFISYRGALALPAKLPLPAASVRPCDACAAPCLAACPVGALGPEQTYDVPACKAHLGSHAGEACLDGCLVRRACPVASGFSRDPAQSAFHMRAFLGA